MSFVRTDSRANNELRPVKITPGFLPYARRFRSDRNGKHKSYLRGVAGGARTAVLRNTGQGWLTAEYSMLPRSTLTRSSA